MSMHKCPHCGNTERFIAPAVVVQDWIVDKDGEYIDTYEDCIDVITYPDEEITWYCAECYEEAIIVEEDDE